MQPKLQIKIKYKQINKENKYFTQYRINCLILNNRLQQRSMHQQKGVGQSQK